MSASDNIVIPIQDDSHDFSTPFSPLPSQNPSPLSTDAIIQHDDNAQEIKAEGSWLWEHISYLIYLAVFGIFGVITRYGLQKLFGPDGLGVTGNILYLDLPSNMVGSFLMGWFGVVFKAQISCMSDHLAVGLSTGYLGSLTTFSGWNQKMLELCAEGEWASAALGYFVGLLLVAYCIILGIETAEDIKWILRKLSTSSQSGQFRSRPNSKVGSFKIHMVVTLVLLVLLVLFYCLSGSLEKNKFNKGGSEAQLLLACMVAPLGVWMRWFLAKKLNGRGLGKNGVLKWLPFGTLIANVSAASIMATFAVLKKAVNTQNFDTIASGIQFGLMGCLSTVSTFIAEFHNMKENNQRWRANAYAMVTILASFIMGTLIYSVPFWINSYN
ncbi:fluoride export protein 1-like [Apium graveolens]|uniref:fluoride export protein 1-like n=1 Tax=Apium graveolens TaxID=4045 RepID=UPI003D7999E0